MTTPFIGPACDVCSNEGAILSVMMLADYQQRKVCPLCAPTLLRQTADEVESILEAAMREDQANAPAVAETAEVNPADTAPPGELCGAEPS